MPSIPPNSLLTRNSETCIAGGSLHWVGSFLAPLPFLLPAFLPMSPHPSPEYHVSISGTSVVLTCPMEAGIDTLKWAKDGVELSEHRDKHLLQLEGFSEMENSGYYSCFTDASKNSRSLLYLKARGNPSLQQEHCQSRREDHFRRAPHGLPNKSEPLEAPRFSCTPRWALWAHTASAVSEMQIRRRYRAVCVLAVRTRSQTSSRAAAAGRAVGVGARAERSVVR